MGALDLMNNSGTCNRLISIMILHYDIVFLKAKPSKSSKKDKKEDTPGKPQREKKKDPPKKPPDRLSRAMNPAETAQCKNFFLFSFISPDEFFFLTPFF